MSERPKRLLVRSAKLEDIPSIREVMKASYPRGVELYTAGMLRGQINRFADGQFVAEYDGKVVGYCSSFRVGGDRALSQHTWHDITGQGYASRHDPQGDYLYGLEVFVHPSYRRHRIGQRFYTRRKQLCRDLNLEGIVFGGRIPGLKRQKKQVKSAQEYVELVRDGQLRDPVLSFQLRQGFELLGVLENYTDEDPDSLGHASHLVWRNPHCRREQEVSRGTGPAVIGLPHQVRLAAVQYQQRQLKSVDEFFNIVRYFVETVSEYRADFVLFPELFTLQLLSIDEELPPVEAIHAITRHTDRIKDEFRRMALRYNVNIIAGSHPTLMDDKSIQNIAYVFLRDGTIHEQSKIHPTPDEAHWWRIQGGNSLAPIETDCGPIGVLICYDSEFPELARHLCDQGAEILFVPFYTDERQGYLRVRHCCQARAIENQCYVAMAGNVGNLPNVHNMDLQYAQSCIITPCDFPFARDGVAADTTPNVEAVALADLSMAALREARAGGTVQNLRNRRLDLYQVRWMGE